MSLNVEIYCVLCQSILGSVIIGSLQQIAQREGFRGMYRGLSPTVLALLPNWAVSIHYIVCFTYHRCMQRFLHKRVQITIRPLQRFFCTPSVPTRKSVRCLCSSISLLFSCGMQVYFTVYEQLKSLLSSNG